MTDFIVFPLIQHYSDKEKAVFDEFRFVIKWLLFISDNKEVSKQELITKLGQQILPKICSPMSSTNGNLLYCFNVMMKVIALPLYEQEIIKPNSNMGVFLGTFPEIVLDKLCQEWLKTIKVGDLPKEGVQNIISNLFDCSAQFQSLKIIDIFSKQLNKSKSF